MDLRANELVDQVLTDELTRAYQALRYLCTLDPGYLEHYFAGKAVIVIGPDTEPGSTGAWFAPSQVIPERLEDR